MGRELKRQGVRTPMEVVPHGVDLEHFRPGTDAHERSAFRSRMGLGSEAELILFVGSLSRRKGLQHLVPAWTELAGRRPKAHLLLVGPEPSGGTGEEAFAEDVRNYLNAGEGADRVHFLGSVPDVAPLMRAADLFVFPSLREGMPNVVGEAFGCALATVLTPFEGLPEEFGLPGREYVQVAHDASALSRSMAELLPNPHRRRELGLAARRWCQEHLDVERSLDRLAEVCRDVAHARAQGREGPPEGSPPHPKSNPIATRRT